MIVVSIRKDGITVIGHASYAPPGQDIVCAGVTALTQTMIKAIVDLTADRIEYEISPGRDAIQYGKLSTKSKTLVDSFFIGVSQISGEFPECVNKI